MPRRCLQKSVSGSLGLSRKGRGQAIRMDRKVFATLLLGLLALGCLLAPWANAQRGRSAAEKRRLAISYFRQALEVQESFAQIPFEQRAAGDYQRVIRAFRRVYWTDPSYSNDTICLMEIGALYEEMGQRWGNERSLESAVETYEFLVREYPGSKFRRQASLAIARIYRDDLKRPEEAIRQYERFIADNPRAPEREDAAQAIAEILAASADPAPPPADRSGTRDSLALVAGVRHWVTPDYARVVIDVERDVQHGVGRVDNPPRVYVDLRGTRPVSRINNRTVPVENGLLRGLKTGRHTPDITRVVLYVGDLTEYSVFELPNPYRVVVDIRNRERPGAAAPELVSSTPARRSEVSGQPQPPSETAATIPTAYLERTERTEGTEAAGEARVADGPVFERVEAAQPTGDGTRSLTRALGLKIGKILLDPGHGGPDTGTIGPSGYREKDLVLDIAKRLGRLIEEQLGSEVVFTRTDDSFVPLETRTAIANQQEADLFLSIHANSSRNQQARGVETYYLNFTTDAEALEVAARENAIAQERISQLQGLVEKIAMAEKVDESKEFATHVQSTVWRTQSVRDRRVADRGVKEAPFVVLIGANMPSALSEIAFLSNPAEEKLLKTEEHRQKIAEALFAGILSYVESLSVVKVSEQ